MAQLAAGDQFTCARMTDGTVTCWGDNSVGQLGDGSREGRTRPARVPGLASVEEIAVGAAFVCARKADATVWCWGANSSGALGHERIAPWGMSAISRPNPSLV
ncbi:BNR repeat domain protein [Minicystis rosea]|nr:BNR repeat domain protein [Minicystis rosea]